MLQLQVTQNPQKQWLKAIKVPFFLMFKKSGFRKCKDRMTCHSIRNQGSFYLLYLKHPQHVAFASWSQLATHAPTIQSSFLEEGRG